jgi:hypothetical protein
MELGVGSWELGVGSWERGAGSEIGTQFQSITLNSQLLEFLTDIDRSNFAAFAFEDDFTFGDSQ